MRIIGHLLAIDICLPTKKKISDTCHVLGAKIQTAHAHKDLNKTHQKNH